MALFDPELVLISGGLVRAGELLLAPARAAFERFVFARDRRILPPVRPAMLWSDAGLVGAALLALHRCAHHALDTGAGTDAHRSTGNGGGGPAGRT